MPVAGTRSGGARFLFVALAASCVTSYAYHLAMTRLLGPAEYGALGALLAVMLVIALPVEAIQAVIARRVTLLPGDGEAQAGVIAPAFRLTARAAFFTFGSVTLAAPILAPFLRIGVGPLLIMGAIAVPTLLAPVGRGALQGQLRFRRLGASLLTGMLVRVCVGTTLVILGAGLTGALAGVLVGETVAAAIALTPLVNRFRARAVVRTAVLLGEIAGAARVLAALWLTASIDVVLARHHLPAEAAGRYAVSALAGRSLLFIALAVSTVVYPRLTEATDEPERRRLLGRSLAGFTLLGLGCAAGAALFPGLVGALFGGGYAGLGGTVPLLALAMTAFGCVVLLAHRDLALDRARSGRLWNVALLEIGLITVFHGSAEVIALSVLASSLLALIGMVPGLSQRRWRHPVGELWREADSDIDLSVVTPTYNGERVIGSHLRELLGVLNAAGIRHEVIVVSDGSTDGTLEQTRPFEADGVRLLHYARNQGKGYALRTGLARASGRYVAFIDSDGDLHPSTLVRFLTLMRMYEADMVIGSKRHPVSEVEYPPLRRLMSWIYHKVVSMMFRIRVQDTQTGVKLIRRDLLGQVLPLLREERFAFDLELLAAARRAGYRRILEAPVVLSYRFASTVSWRSVVGILRDTIVIWSRCYITRRYDPAPPRTVTVPPHPAPAGTPVEVGA